MDLGPLQSAAELYVGILAVTILVAATNAGVLGVSRLVYSMGLHRQMPDAMRRLHPRFRTPYLGILAFSGFACLALAARPGRLPRRDLRVRRDAVVLDGAPRGAAAARDPARRRAPVPQPGQRAHPRPRPAAARARRPRRHRRSRCSSSARSTSPSPRPAAAGWRSASSSTSSTAAARGSTSSRPTRSRSPSRSSTARRSTTRCSSTSATAATTSSCSPPPPSSPRASAAASTCSSRSPCRTRSRSTPRCREAEAAARVDHRAGQAAGRPARVRPLGEGPRGPGRAADHRGGAGHARRRGRDRAAAPDRRHVGVRQDARDGAGGAAVPRDHRVAAARQARPADRA